MKLGLSTVLGSIKKNSLCWRQSFSIDSNAPAFWAPVQLKFCLASISVWLILCGHGALRISVFSISHLGKIIPGFAFASISAPSHLAAFPKNRLNTAVLHNATTTSGPDQGWILGFQKKAYCIYKRTHEFLLSSVCWQPMWRPWLSICCS